MSIFENCYNELKGKITNIEITPQTIIKVLRMSMEIVEATEAKGEAQKTLVEALVKQVVVDAPISDFKEKMLKYILRPPFRRCVRSYNYFYT